MVSVEKSWTVGRLPQVPASTVNTSQSAAARRLDHAFQRAPVIPFDDRSRIVFFSDLHRGDNGPADAFAPNEEIFLRALEYYYARGYTYVEVGDGDELWKNRRFRDVRRAHPRVYDWLERFHAAGRLYLLVGNHQLLGRWASIRRQNPLLSGEALILRHSQSGQRILVVHGHQADGFQARIYGVARLAVRHFWRHAQHLSRRILRPRAAHSPLTDAIWEAVDWTNHQLSRLEMRLVDWLHRHGDVMICGHTHHPVFALPGDPPYFNVGMGTNPGFITGLEIRGGQISLIGWTRTPHEGPGAQSLAVGPIRHEVLAGPRPLRTVG